MPASGQRAARGRVHGARARDPDGDALTYAWSFGDGATGAGRDRGAHLRDPGTYTATVTATDPDGATDTASVTVR